MHAGWWKQLTLALLLGAFFTGTVAAQEGVWQGEKDQPMLRATLRNKDKNAKERAAVLEVEAQNIGLVDPDVTPMQEAPRDSSCTKWIKAQCWRLATRRSTFVT